MNPPVVGTVVPGGHIALLGYCYMRPGVLWIVAGQTLWISGKPVVNLRTTGGKYAQPDVRKRENLARVSH